MVKTERVPNLMGVGHSSIDGSLVKNKYRSVHVERKGIRTCPATDANTKSTGRLGIHRANSPSVVPCPRFPKVINARILGGHVNIERQKIFSDMQELLLNFAQLRIRETTRVIIAIKCRKDDIVFPSIIDAMVSIEIKINRFRCGGITLQKKSILPAIREVRYLFRVKQCSMGVGGNRRIL